MSMKNFMEKYKENCVDGCTLCKVKLGIQILDEDDVVSYCTHKKFITDETPNGKVIASNCREREIRHESKVPIWCPMNNFSCPLHEIDANL